MINLEREYPDLRTFFSSKDKKWFKKCASQRARLGLAYCDTWNFDTFLLGIIIRGLRQLADTSHGYPGYEPFDTFEKWQIYLLDLADKFALASKYIYDEDDYWETHTCQESVARHEQGEKLLKEAFSELAEHFPALWD